MTSPSLQTTLALVTNSVVGNPTQFIFEKVFAHHNLDWRYMSFEVDEGNLTDAVKGLKALGFHGAHVGRPHQHRAVPYVDRLSERVQAIGAVGFFYRDGIDFLGENFEGLGLVSALKKQVDPAGKHVVLIGSGNAARAAAWELATAGVGSLTLLNRTDATVPSLVEMLAKKPEVAVTSVVWQGHYALPADADILIHAGSVSAGYPRTEMPVLAETLRPEMLVADFCFDPPRTTLLEEAAARGCKTLDGLTIFIEHITAAFTLWTGIQPDVNVLRDAAEEYLDC